MTLVNEPRLVDSATVPPEVVSGFDAASRNCTVIVDEPSVVMLVGDAVIRLVAVDAAPTEIATVASSVIATAFSVPVIVAVPMPVEVSVAV